MILGAIGYDIAVAVDPESYEIVEDARGRAWAFEMDETTQRQLGEAVLEALPSGADPDAVEVQPGYVRVRIPKPDYDVQIHEIVSALRDAADIYNDRHADYADTTVAFSKDRFVGTYLPEDRPDREAFLAREVDQETAPGADEPVWTYTREDAGEAALGADTRVAYRTFIAFDADALYNPGRSNYETITLAVEWDREEVHDHLRSVVEDPVPWPGDPRDTMPRVAVYPTHVEMDFYGQNTGAPAAVARKMRRAFLKYNRHRPIDDERSPTNTKAKHPPVSFTGSAFVRALDQGKSAEEWIDEHGLDEIDGQPVDPDPDPEEDVESGTIDKLNPFS